MAQSTDGRSIESLVYTTEQAARLIHPEMSPRTLERWRLNGQGPRFIKVGRRVAYRLDAIEQYLDAQTRRHTSNG